MGHSNQMTLFPVTREGTFEVKTYPKNRKQIDKDANSTYKLSPIERDIVGLLQVLGNWSNTRIAEQYGVDRAVVSRHGKRIRERMKSGHNFRLGD